MQIVVAAIIFNEYQEVLIAKRDTRKKYGSLWEFPGGKVEESETLTDAVIREIKEELSLEIWPITICAEGLTPDIRIFALHCSKKINDYPTPLEHEKIRWVPVIRIPEYSLTPGTEALYKDWMKI